MPRTKPALHPLVDTIDRDSLARKLANVILVSERRIAKEFARSLEALEVPASDPDRGQLCIVATQAEVRVALRSSMPSDEELSHEVHGYRFWFGLPPGVDKSQLGGLPPAAIEILAFLQLWVRAVNKMIDPLGFPSDSAEVRSFIDDIHAEAAAFVVCLTATTAGSRVASMASDAFAGLMIGACLRQPLREKHDRVARNSSQFAANYSE